MQPVEKLVSHHKLAIDRRQLRQSISHTARI